MKKRILSPAYLVLLLVFIFSNRVFSQDDIIMRNDDVTKAKVEEVGTAVIRYRKADNMDGPIYDMPKADVYMIVYANGQRDVINPRPGGESPAPAAAVSSGDAIRVAPPEMPVYEQPLCPAEGYIWTPGYWAYNIIGGYYWVPGVWVSPPRVGYLWTPGYWGFVGGIYGWHVGYWGEHIGFYGGVNYGYGYGGRGYDGGRWEGGAFRYNTAISRVDVRVVHTTYIDKTVVHETVVNRTSFNGGNGVRAEANEHERAAMKESHVNMTHDQQSHTLAAKNDKSQYHSENHGHPANPAMDKPSGQHFNSDGHPIQHTPTPVNTPTHNNAPANNGAPHNNAPNNNTHTNTPANNNGGQHSQPVQSPQQHSQPAQQQQHSQPVQQQHAQPAQQQQHTQPAQQQHAQPVQQQHPAAQPARPVQKPTNQHR